MKATINQDIFNSALQAVKPFSGGTLPIYNTVLLNFDEVLTVACSNGESIAIRKIECDIKKPGTLAIPIKLLSDYVSTLKNDDIELQSDGFNDLKLKQGKAKPKIKGFDPDDFQMLPEFPNDGIEINFVDFKSILTKVLYAVATDKSRLMFTGVNFKTMDGMLRLTSADGFRAAYYDIECPTEDNLNIVVPSEILREFGKFNNVDTVKITMTDNNVIFWNDELMIKTQVIDSAYPDITRIEPDKYSFEITLNKPQFVNLLKRANIFASHNDNRVRLEFSNRILNIMTGETEIGSDYSEMECGGDGEGNITFNCNYLLSTLGVLENDSVIVKYVSEKSPIIIKENGLTCINMPIHTKE